MLNDDFIDGSHPEVKTAGFPNQDRPQIEAAKEVVIDLTGDEQKYGTLEIGAPELTKLYPRNSECSSQKGRTNASVQEDSLGTMLGVGSANDPAQCSGDDDEKPAWASEMLSLNQDNSLTSPLDLLSLMNQSQDEEPNTENDAESAPIDGSKQTQGIKRKHTPKTTRDHRPKNSKEWWARKYAEEKAKSEGKIKRQKMDPDANRSAIQRKRRSGKGKPHADLLKDLEIGGANFTAYGQGPAAAAPQFKASTKQQQYAANQMIAKHSKMSERGTSLNVLKQATQSFGYGKVKAHGRNHLLEGMSTGKLYLVLKSLWTNSSDDYVACYSHQIVGASWCLGREYSYIGPKGGILADDMVRRHTRSWRD